VARHVNTVCLDERRQEKVGRFQPPGAGRHLSRCRKKCARRRAADEASLTQQATAHRAPQHESVDVARAAAGDREAFERLYRTHAPRILGLARRIAGFELAEDLTQDVFVRAWEKLPGFRGDSQFGTWLYRLAINVMVEDRRRSSRWRRRDDDEDVLANLATATEDDAFAIDFEDAVARLPAAARKVFVLHDVEGYKHREIGKLIGITDGTSKGQLHRARMILRRYLRSGHERADR
jgi:RNA polymerase sigma-70 factor (ECF subfamily)